MCHRRGPDTLSLCLTNKKCLFFLTKQLCLEPRGSSRAPFPSLPPSLPSHTQILHSFISGAAPSSQPDNALW